MTVKELIKKLEDMDETMEVLFSYDYGDYPNTMVAAKIFNVDESEVIYSDYHRMDRIINDGDEEEREGSRVVVILN